MSYMQVLSLPFLTSFFLYYHLIRTTVLYSQRSYTHNTPSLTNIINSQANTNTLTVISRSPSVTPLLPQMFTGSQCYHRHHTPTRLHPFRHGES